MVRSKAKAGRECGMVRSETKVGWEGESVGCKLCGKY